jgi:hypothetical protein
MPVLGCMRIVCVMRMTVSLDAYERADGRGRRRQLGNGSSKRWQAPVALIGAQAHPEPSTTRYGDDESDAKAPRLLRLRRRRGACVKAERSR